MLKPILWLCLLLTSSLPRAEIIQGINFVDTLGEIKQRFPNATFVKLKPAWLQPDEAFILIEGVGLPGALRVFFEDGRPAIKRFIKKNEGVEDFDKSGFFKKVAEASDDESLTVNWVRWVPRSPIPMASYKTKYGPPVCGFDENMSPECKWEKVALVADVTSDRENVLGVTTGFTKAEKRSAWMNKHGFIPDYLK